MTRPTISIVMATYNGARYLPEQLESLLTQRYQPHELVVGDDGSRDDTLAILDAFARRVPFPVRVIRNEPRLGFADNFLSTASQCSGDWIAFCDQDDVWTPNKLFRLSAEIARDPLLTLVAHQVELTDQNGRPLGRRPGWHGWTGDRRYPRGTFPPFAGIGGIALCVRGDLLRDIDWRERSRDRQIWKLLGAKGSDLVPHDRWAVLLGGALGTIALIDHTLVNYRRHDFAETGFHAHSTGWDAPATSDARAHLADAAESAKEAFLRAAQAIGGERGLNLVEAATRFQRVARSQRQRAGSASPNRRLARARALFLGALNGNYFGRDGAGTKSFARDLLNLLLR